MVPVHLRRLSRLPHVPAWATALALGSGLWVVSLALLDRRFGWGTTACAFKRMTGHPCPTCGSTRGFLALLRGHPGEALAFNPLVFGGLAILAGLLLFRVATGRAPEIAWTPAKRRSAWILAAGAVLANWLYLGWKGV
jgi:hypothetical protein